MSMEELTNIEKILSTFIQLFLICIVIKLRLTNEEVSYTTKQTSNQSNNLLTNQTYTRSLKLYKRENLNSAK